MYLQTMQGTKRETQQAQGKEMGKAICKQKAQECAI